MSDSPLLVGFFAGSARNIGEAAGDGATTDLAYDYTASIAPFSNVIFVGSDAQADLVARVKRAASMGKKSVVMIEYLLFPYKVPIGAPAGTAAQPTFLPDENYQTIFTNFWSALGPLQSSVAGFYIFDEPYKHNFCAGTQNNNCFSNAAPGPNNMVSTQQMREGLDNVIHFVKSLTGKPTMMIFSPDLEVPNPLFSGTMLPPELDYFGVDCYLEFGAICSESNIYYLFSILKSALGPKQKLMFALDATGPISSDAALSQRNQLWAKIIGDNLSITGAIVPFIYQNAPSDNVIGLVSLPLTYGSVTTFMRGYLDLLKCNGEDLFDSQKGTVVESHSKYCQAKCEGADLVTRTLQGEVVATNANSTSCPKIFLSTFRNPGEVLVPGCFTGQGPVTIHTLTYKQGMPDAPSGLRAHVFYPPGFLGGTRLPVVAAFHGGGWNAGNPMYWAAGARYLASRGAAVVSFEYREYGVNGNDPTEAVRDAVSAIRWLRKNADALAIDPQKILATGDSAGGHLALMTALYRGPSDETGADAALSYSPQGVVAFYPVLDTTSPEFTSNTNSGGMQPQISPILSLSSTPHAPFLILQGDADTIELLNPNGVPAATNAIQFCNKSNSYVSPGVRCWNVTVSGAPHSFMDDFEGSYGSGVGENDDYRFGMAQLDSFMGDLGFSGFTADSLASRLNRVTTAIADCSTNHIPKYWDLTYLFGYPLRLAGCGSGQTTQSGVACTGTN